MSKAKIHFQRLIQDSQDYGSDDEHMVSRVFFQIDIDGQVHPNLYADVKQTVGSSFEEGPLEVSRPVGYRGPFDHAVFSTVVEHYYRGLVGASGSGIRISGGANIRMRNNTFVQQATAEMDVSTSGGPW